MYKVSFTLTGTTPLLMHFDNIEGGDQLKAWRQEPKNKNKSVAGDDRSPAWTWHTYLYSDGEHVAMPQDNVMAALKYGGKQVPLKSRLTCERLTQTGLVMDSEFLEFTFGKGVRLPVAKITAMRDLEFAEQVAAAEKLGFRLFCKRATIGQAKHVRVRPRFEKWQVAGTLTVFSEDLTFPMLERIFENAGNGGLCDWRPSSKKGPGPFGMFTASLKSI